MQSHHVDQRLTIMICTNHKLLIKYIKESADLCIHSDQHFYDLEMFVSELFANVQEAAPDMCAPASFNICISDDEEHWLLEYEQPHNGDKPFYHLHSVRWVDPSIISLVRRSLFRIWVRLIARHYGLPVHGHTTSLPPAPQILLL